MLHLEQLSQRQAGFNTEAPCVNIEVTWSARASAPIAAQYLILALFQLMRSATLSRGKPLAEVVDTNSILSSYLFLTSEAG